MIGYYVSTGHKSDYAVAHLGDTTVQIVENAPDHIHWLIVREGAVEQRIALSFSTLMVLCKAVSMHPVYKRIESEEGVK